jgi:NAD(P)H-flavin reductase
MATRQDIGRARLGTLKALEDLDATDRRLASCHDGELGLLLGDIHRRKATQTSRLLEWLGRQGEGLGGSSQSRHGTSMPSEEPAGPVSEDESLTPSSSDHEAGVAVNERLDITPDLLVFKVPRPLDFTFVPGQSVKVGLAGMTRSYSIVSAPHEPILEFFVELVPGGRMSERLRDLAVGTRITLGEPKGSFVLDPRYRRHLMVATVTGINPFISMIRDSLHRDDLQQRFHLLQGASYLNEFGYREELEAIAAAHPERLTYVPTVSRPNDPANAGWTGRQGRVDAIVDSHVEQAGLASGDTMLYLCGHAGMIEGIEQRYRTRGFPVKREDYD